MHLMTSFGTTIETAMLVGHGRELKYFLNFAELNPATIQIQRSCAME